MMNLSFSLMAVASFSLNFVQGFFTLTFSAIHHGLSDSRLNFRKDLHETDVTPNTFLGLNDHRVLAPARRNPNAEKAEAIARKICKKHGICLPNIREYETMTSFCFPRTSEDRLVVTTLLMNLLWFIDDIFDRDLVEVTSKEEELRKAGLYKKALKIMFHGASDEDDTSTGIFGVCQEIWIRLDPLVPRHWFRRLETSLKDHLMATLLGSADAQAEDGHTSLDSFMSVRELDSGVYIGAQLIEFVTGTYLPDDIIGSPEVQEMIIRNVKIGAYSNDIFSYEKEVIRLGSSFNLVKVVMDESDKTFTQAVHDCIELVNGCFDSLLVTADQVVALPCDDEELRTKLRNYVQGHLDFADSPYHWALYTSRYKSATSPFPELRI